MVSKFQQDVYVPVNPSKYVGDKPPYFRSSWERIVMEMLDTHPNILHWASEPIKIPYLNPFTGKYTVYVPDFIVTSRDINGVCKTEIIEVKPAKEAVLEFSKSQKSRAAFALNSFKWAAAEVYAKNHSMTFRVMTEYEIFNNPKGKG